MPWVDLQAEILEDFASFTGPAHSEEWDHWCRHEERARLAVESETLGIREDIESMRNETFAPERVRGLRVDDVLELQSDFLQRAADLADQRRRQHAKKINTSARASRSFYTRVMSDPERREQHYAKKRHTRWARKHFGQGELL